MSTNDKRLAISRQRHAHDRRKKVEAFIERRTARRAFRLARRGADCWPRCRLPRRCDALPRRPRPEAAAMTPAAPPPPRPVVPAWIRARRRT